VGEGWLVSLDRSDKPITPTVHRFDETRSFDRIFEGLADFLELSFQDCFANVDVPPQRIEQLPLGDQALWSFD
jgi:hypothetical protein